jgi:lipopolysaccharide transport system ATP-binding protein
MSSEQRRASAEVVVRADHLTKTFRVPHPNRIRKFAHARDMLSRERFTAVDDVSFEVHRGEVFGLIGANGSGKSTVLRLVAGLTRPSGGAVLRSAGVNGLLSLGEGLQNELSGRDNAYTVAILAGLPPRVARAKLDWITEFSELGDVMDQPLRTYSDGMRMRLAFAASVAVEPEILVVDELLAVGDIRFRQRCIDHMRGLAESGSTILVTSHSPAELEEVCDRAIWLRNGRTMSLGDVETVSHHYANAMRDAVGPASVESDGSMRLGSGEAEIADIYVTTPSGIPIEQLRAGEPVAFEFTISRCDVDRAILGVSLSLEDGTTVLDLVQDAEERGVPITPGARFRIELERLDLGNGDYFVDVGLYAPGWTHPFDYRWHARSFSVLGLGQPGKLTPPHRWSCDAP